jgi:hypothetical protein
MKESVMRKLMMVGLVALAGQALASGVFLSEYIETNLGNNKALEIYNATGATVDMADYAIWRISNGGDWVEGQSNDVVFADLTTELLTDLFVEPGGTFTIVNSAATLPELIDNADVLGTSATFFNGDDAIGLAMTTDGGDTWTLIDAIGEEGPDPGAGWTVSGVANGTVDRTLVRLPNICAGNTDWATAQDEWIVYPNLTVTYFGAHESSCGGGNLPPMIGLPSVTPDPVPADDAALVSAEITDDSAVAGALIYYGTDPGDLAAFEVMTPMGDIYSAILPGNPACTQVFYQIVATDDVGAETSSPVYNYTVLCQLTIAEIQGGGEFSPYDGQTVTTQGIVTATANPGLGSFFIQDAAAAWSGIQVYGSNAVLVGDEVLVTGEVEEYFGQTEILLDSFTVLTNGNELPAPVMLPDASAIGEAYESVRVCFESELVCLSLPNQWGEWLVEDAANEMVIDDLFYAADPSLGACYRLCGIVNFSFGLFRLNPVSEADIESCDPVLAGELAGSFELGLAWPNPFNPSTNLSFSVERTAAARLAVYDLLGREVAVLVDGMVEAGAHMATFDAGALPSGVYFARLSSEGRSATQRLLLVR